MSKLKTAIFLIVIALASAVTIFVSLFLLRPRGELILDQNLTSDEQSLFQNALTGIQLDSNLEISAHQSLTFEAKNGSLVAVYVPTTDFYSSKTSITSAEAIAIWENPESNPEITFLPLVELDHSKKLLTIDDQYYLTSLKSGAIFRQIAISGDEEGTTLAQNALDALALNFPAASDQILTLAQTGVTALSRRMNGALAQSGDATLFATGLKDYLSNFDLTHTSNESSFSSYASSQNICSDSRFIDTLTAIGLDIVELTGNHNNDCGYDDARATIDLYHSLNIQTVGGGKTATDAAVPLTIDSKNTKITLFAYNLSTGGYTTGDYPGANLYNETTAATEIAAAKQAGDTVIVDVQYYECNAYASTTEDNTCDYADSAAGDQVGFFRHLIDLGADIVVGTAAHQPQTFELYGNGAIYYGLGNLFFDQSWWPGTTRSLILEHYFWDGQLLQTRITPTAYDDSYITQLMPAADAANFLTRLTSVRPTN